MSVDDVKIVLWIEDKDLSHYKVLQDYAVSLITVQSCVARKPNKKAFEKLLWNSKSLVMYYFEKITNAPGGAVGALKRWGNQGFVRRLYFHQYLLDNPNTDRVFLTDVRDVFFQDNLFNRKIEKNKLYIARDYGLVADSAKVRRWVRIFLGRHRAQEIAQKPLYCSGTILGHRQPILDLLAYYEHELLKRNFFLWGLDTALFLNYVFNILGEDYCVSMGNRECDLVVTAPQNISSFPQLNAFGEPFACVHMYDRVLKVKNLVREKYDAL